MSCDLKLLKIVSGGQTGVDRAALDAALAASVPCGGWCPEGRLAGDGPIPARYPVVDLPGADYRRYMLGSLKDAVTTVIFSRLPR